MKERPILFSTEMVKAILDDRKTQTRRLTKLKKVNNKGYYFLESHKIGDVTKFTFENNQGLIGVYPPYEIGDILWVRETWTELKNDITMNNEVITPKGYYFKADNFLEATKWKPSIFMPKEACRIKLKITDIRVERLGNVTEEEVEKEGTPLKDKYGMNLFSNKISAFASLWCRVHKSEDAWQNDIMKYVWVITFERIK